MSFLLAYFTVRECQAYIYQCFLLYFFAIGSTKFYVKIKLIFIKNLILMHFLRYKILQNSTQI